MPERDIESLGVLGWGLDAVRKFFRRRHRHRPPNVVCLQCKKYMISIKNRYLFWGEQRPLREHCHLAPYF